MNYENKMYTIIISDKHGINRCWANGKTLIAAISNAVNMAADYGEMRPDLLPLTVNYENRVRKLEAEGMTRSDAQAVADAQFPGAKST